MPNPKAQAQAPAFGFVQAPVGEGSFTASGQRVQSLPQASAYHICT